MLYLKRQQEKRKQSGKNILCKKSIGQNGLQLLNLQNIVQQKKEGQGLHYLYDLAAKAAG
jgi:hypothetical protein